MTMAVAMLVILDALAMEAADAVISHGAKIPLLQSGAK
jgi:hypothetical protein